MQTTLNPPKGVDSRAISEVIGRLWELVWFDCKGEGAWNGNPDGSYDFFPRWGVSNQALGLKKIEGSLDGKPYSMNFVGISVGFFELTLEDVTYDFSSNPRYGHFSQEGVKHLTSGSAYFALRHSDEAVSDFLKAPSRSHGFTHRPRWLMTPEREQEVVQFVDQLISAIKQLKERKQCQ